VTLVHVPATDPLCAGCHPNLITHAIITDCGAAGMRAMEEIIARKWRIISARITHAIMDRIVPVIIVIGVHSVPPTVMRFERVMGPANAGVCAGYNNVLSCKTQCPYLWRMRVIDARFDRVGLKKMRRRFVDCLRLRKMILDVWITFYPRHVRSRS